MNLLNKCLTGLIMVLILQGCELRPWVKNYERNHLAKPQMSFTRDPAAAAFMNHLRESREAARGASAGGGGGCGCN